MKNGLILPFGGSRLRRCAEGETSAWRGMENFRLKVFRTVAEQASFRKASERLNLSQPAVSQQVHALEEELGVTLFDRGGNRVRLTAAGTVLLQYARQGAQLAAEAREALAKMRGRSGG